MAINNKGDKIIIGDDDGVVSLLKLSTAFYDMTDFDKRKSDESNFFNRL